MMVTGPAVRPRWSVSYRRPSAVSSREERHMTSSPDDQRRGLTLRVARAVPRDAGRGMARLDPADMARIGAKAGD